MKKAKLKSKLEDIIDIKQKIYSEFEKKRSDNPQIKDMMSRIEAETTAFVSVLDALNNNDAMINCY